MNSKILKKKQVANSLIKNTIFIVASFSIIILIIMFSFILFKAFPAFKGKGFVNIFFTSDITKFGIWGALSISFITSVGAILIALPISKRIAILIRYRLEKYGRPLRIIIDILAGIPSVVYGVFALSSLGKFAGLITGTKSVLTIFNATLMLAIMVIPTMVSLITNQLFLVKPTLLESSIALGNTKTKAIYSIALKNIKSGIYVAAIVALGRAIGETMATSMILTSSTPSNIFKEGFGFINQGYSNLASAIANYMFTDSSDDAIVQNAFAMGLSLFIFIMILVSIVTRISNKKKISINKPFAKNEFKYIFVDILKLPFTFLYYVTYSISYLIKKIKLFIVKILYKIRFLFIDRFIKYKNNFTLRSKKIAVIYSIFWEIISALIVISIVFWILIEIITKGVPNINSKDFDIKKDGIMNALIWTLILISVSIIIALPLALFTAIFLSEYAQNNWFGKIVKFFLDSLGGTPSILFGIFGMVLFIQILDIKEARGQSSLLAGALTMMLVILPTYTRSVEQVIINIPYEMREASLALGATKWETIRKIIIPQAIAGIISGTILSMSRIISETAPVFLTLGMSYNPKFGLLKHGQTLTTHILGNQIYDIQNESARIASSYKYALATIIIITLLITISYSINPLIQWIKKIKHKKKYINIGGKNE
ncbi:phosphate ABC transporter permease PstA [Mycoplasmopsis lipofaciens]|uniref:phosphate ABC transporter permease PstA n=1 Tax=Mycoplasmopsis lipofaciens TaxID=114884 RepID=UPI00047F29B9|nr:phosphate ABC transporter permease PstA [Mycoplasmopsis lipofaciens]